jgi:hypothetical protein
VAGRAGTSNARRWRRLCSARRSTFTPAGSTSILARLLALNPVVPALFARLAGTETQVRRLLGSTGSQVDAEGVRLYRRLVSDAAHVDGLLAEGPEKRRYVREPHAYILGVTLSIAAAAYGAAARNEAIVTSAILISLVQNVVFVAILKAKLGYDDALDTFGVHAVGGTMGAILTGMLARNAANANLATNLKTQVTDTLFQPLLVEQLKAVVVTLVLSVVATIVIAYIVKATIGLRVDEEVETLGLDLSEHGEEGYHGN